MKRLLILEFHRLGDAIMGLPFLRGAAREYEVHVACSPASRPIYASALPAERLVTWEPGGRVDAFRRLRKIEAEIAVSVWADVRDHLLMRALGIPRRVGFPMNEVNYYAHHLAWRRRSLRIGETIQAACRAVGVAPLTEPLQRRSYHQHHVADWAQLAEALGFLPDLSPPWIDLAPGGLPERAERFLEKNRGRKIWLLHPGAAKENRKWPHYGRVIVEVFAKHDVPLILFQPSDGPILEVPATYANCLPWPQGPLDEFLRLTSRSDLVLCNDSAAAHVGAAFGKQVLTVFGPGSSEWFAPYAPAAKIFESSVCPFRPCIDRCVQPSYICLEDVSFDRVAEGIERALFPA